MGKRKGRESRAEVSPPRAAALDVPAIDGEPTSRERFVEQQRAFSDREVQRRITAIQAIRDAEIESLLSRLHLLRSCLSNEQWRTSALQFFRQYLPNLSLIKKEKEGIFELEWKDKVSHFPLNHATGGNVLASLDSNSNMPASFKGNLLNAARLLIPALDVDEPSETQSWELKDGFNIPGVIGHRLSAGVTPQKLRLPKDGEMLLSVHGSPLGAYHEENLEAINEPGDGSDGPREEAMFPCLAPATT